jgi:hypothetical protein
MVCVEVLIILGRRQVDSAVLFFTAIIFASFELRAIFAEPEWIIVNWSRLGIEFWNIGVKT